LKKGSVKGTRRNARSHFWGEEVPKQKEKNSTGLGTRLIGQATMRTKEGGRGRLNLAHSILTLSLGPSVRKGSLKKEKIIKTGELGQKRP